MQGKTHGKAGAIFTVSALSAVLIQGARPEFSDILITFAGIAAGTALPDIDNKQSPVGRCAFFLRPFQGTYHHRDKITHTPVFPVLILLSRLIPGIPQDLSLFLLYFALGYFLHLLLDTFTEAGIRWLAPISNYSFTLRHKKSGSFFEPLVGVILSLLFSAFCIITHIV